MAVVVDSSVLVAALHREDALHERALHVLASAAKPILISEYIAVETIGVLTAKKHKGSAAVLLHALAEGGICIFMPSTASLFGATAQYFLKTLKRLSFVDCSLVLMAQSQKVITFDRTLSQTIRDSYRI